MRIFQMVPPNAFRILGGLLIVGALFSFLYVTFFVLVSDTEYRTGFVPDDTYYYLTLARNFATSGSWTFDSGISETTGYHLLHAYWLAATFKIGQFGTESYISFAILVGILLTVAAALIGAVFAWRTRKLFPMAVLCLMLLSRNVCLNAVSGLEWAWVVLISALYCWSIARTNDSGRHYAWLVPGVLGLLGSLARSDFGLLPFTIAVVALAAHLGFGFRKLTTRAMGGFGGAVLGLAIVLSHNFAVSGQWISSSAAMKRTWLEIYGISTSPIQDILLSLFARTNGSTKTLVGLLVGLVLVVGIAACIGPRRLPVRWRFQPSGPISSSCLVLWIGSALAVIGYTVLYSRTMAGIQVWYSANIIVPVFLFLTLPAANYRLPVWIRTVSLVLVFILGVRQVPVTVAFVKTPNWPAQALSVPAGRYLATNNFNHRVGSWNAGILGYYEGGGVTNLDGKVNNEILPYIAGRNVGDYLDQVGIEFVIDSSRMFNSESRLRRSGIAGAGFLEKMTINKSFQDARHPEWGSLDLYQLEPTVRPASRRD